MREKPPKYSALVISFLIAAAVVLLSISYGEPMGLAMLYEKLIIPICRLLFFITAGLVVGQIIESTGWTESLSIVARPLFRYSNLGNRCSSAFTAAFISGVISNAMLLDFYEENKITKMQLFMTNYLNQLPAFFLHLPTTFFIVVPLTGTAGILYFAITFAATLVRTFCVIIFGHLYPPLQKTGSPDDGRAIKAQGYTDGKGKPSRLRDIRNKIKAVLPARIVNITVYLLPIYTLVFVLNHNGFFLYLNQELSSHLTLDFMPVESLSVVMLSFAAEFTSGFAAAGALMDAGVLSTKQTVMALLLGNITAFPIRALRHQLPRYMGIFSPKMGLQLLISGQIFRVLSIIFVGVLYYAIT
ncbi:MAG: nucleoside recognition protein [Desulfamplus sp.]|nr:nucleoside recognition protein [Desulfamplus sp.]